MGYAFKSIQKWHSNDALFFRLQIYVGWHRLPQRYIATAVIRAAVKQIKQPAANRTTRHERFAVVRLKRYVLQRMPFLRLHQQRSAMQSAITDDIAIVGRIVVHAVDSE